MGSIIDIIGSFIIGALVILALLGLNTSLRQTSFEMTSSDISQGSVEELVSIIRNDFTKIGHGVSSSSQRIISFAADNITFKADINSDEAPEQIQYYMSDSTAVPSTPNPGDCYLYRVVNGANPVGTALGVTDFQLTYFDGAGNQATSAATVRSLEVKLVVESLYPCEDGGYAKSERLFRVTPMSLQL